MLFDANTETPPHQDWWYLDSIPNGQLQSSWIALEDIHEDAGRFYVVPGSQLVRLHRIDGRNLSHTAWLARIRQYVDENRNQVLAPALNKGDVLFWNSRLIHGALPTKNAMYSRKSLTAQFLPSHLHFGNLFTTKDWITYQYYYGHRYFANQPEYSVNAMLASKVKQAIYDHPRILRLVRKIQKHSISDV
jgi:phytanoyl-CoA hydroxylase